MSSDHNTIEYVKQAQLGHRDCMSHLSELAHGKLRAYIYRVTLDDELTSDLVQETLLQMVKSLEDLQKPESFWSWLYRIAMNKIQQYYRQLKTRKTIVVSTYEGDILANRVGDPMLEGVRKLEQQEMSRKVFTAMEKLKQRDRAVISLRCFEDMPFSEIASVMDCTEINARLIFYRAKLAMKQQLARYGIGSSSLLLALGLFGKITAPVEAVGSQGVVSAASVKVGIGTALVGYMGTKVALVVTSAILFVAITAGTVSVLHEEPPGLQRDAVSSFHYTVQSRDNNPGAVASLSKGAYEQWFYFPDGIDGAMFRRMQRWTPDQTGKLCSWVQNGQGNYYYHCGEGKVYINNYHLWLSSLRTMRLPSDPPELIQFLDLIEGADTGIQQQRNQNGLLIDAIDNRFVDARNFLTEYSYNTLEKSFFDYTWGEDIPVDDQRDQMHLRGWTYYELSGEINGQKITGGGMVPFTYDTAQEHPACFTLQVDDALQYVDNPQGAYICKVDGTCTARYPSGSLMEGWMRPWMGFHVVDSIRRDAAEKRLRFETIPLEEGDFTEIIVFDNLSDNRLRYLIDMEKDRIDQVWLNSSKDSRIGTIHLYYYDDIHSLQDEPVIPENPDGVKRVPLLEDVGIEWLFLLAKGDQVEVAGR